MWADFKKKCHRLLKFLRLSPLSLAEKCRIAFGAAIVFIVGLALLIPYIWMGQLTKKAALDVGRVKSEMLLRQHFKIKNSSESALASLDITGAVIGPNESEIYWIRFKEDDQKDLCQLSETQREIIESLKTEKDRSDQIQFEKKDGRPVSNYIRVFRATQNCLSCHNPQGSAGAFAQNEMIGAAVIQRSADGISKTELMNRVWIIVAGLIAGAGAIVTFYIITQRVILRPIRQLRGLANNVAEGNLDIRSSIKTHDEYEKLTDAYNN